MPDLALTLAGGGVAVVAAAWATTRRVRERMAMAAALNDADPSRRRSALDGFGDRWLSAYSKQLLGLSRHEQDPAVLAALFELVNRRQWEPADSRAMLELRQWAAERAAELAAERAAELAAERAAELAAEAPAALTAQPDAPARRRRDTGGDAVLVTGAGGPAGVSVIRALRARGVPVIGADSDPLAAGLRLADESCLLPRYASDGFAERLCELAQKYRASALISTLAEEMLVLSRSLATIEAAGISCWMPATAALEACVDKWRFAGVLREHGLPHPPTALDSGQGVPGPWIVKPRLGRGSRGVLAVDDPEDLPGALRRQPDSIVQSRIEGREFTVDALVGRDGDLAAAVPRWRVETKAGISTKGETFADERVHALAGRVLQAIGLTGPANLQGFAGGDGSLTVIEVNPRFSGGLPLSLAAGADLVGEYLRAVRGEAPRREHLGFRPGVVMTRYFEELFEG